MSFLHDGILRNHAGSSLISIWRYVKHCVFLPRELPVGNNVEGVNVISYFHVFVRLKLGSVIRFLFRA